MIKIIDYGMGNCGSVENMLRYLGAEASIISHPDQLEDASGIILPGVGSYDHGVRSIKPFREVLERKVIENKVPFLGICLGMQLLLESSEEGTLNGLGWIKGSVKRFNFVSEPSFRGNIPHMGWNYINPINRNTILQTQFDGQMSRFYFVHSYHADMVPHENQMATCKYGYEFVCAVIKENIFGVQFHPEKSHKYGKDLFRKFIELTL